MPEQIEIICKLCRIKFCMLASHYRATVKKNNTRKYCSKVCSGKAHQSLPGKQKFATYNGIIEKIRKVILEKRPVTSLDQMTPEKQEEMRRLYDRSSKMIIKKYYANKTH